MTKEEAVKAAAMGVPVVYLGPTGDKRIPYRRIASVIWQYATLDGTLPEKRVSVELLRDDGSRGTDVYPVALVEAANPGQWVVQKEIAVQPEPEKPKAKRKVFVKPSVEDVAAYAAENLLNVNARAFWDHYETCGWVVGKNKPMKSWQAAVRQWDRRETEFSGRSGSASDKPEPAQSSFETDAFFAAALAKSYGGGGWE